MNYVRMNAFLLCIMVATSVTAVTKKSDSITKKEIAALTLEK
jgi:hypothetical protein